jgi:hypothetical protein
MKNKNTKNEKTANLELKVIGASDKTLNSV